MYRLLALVALAACSDFASIERDVCGNGILEPGEDCDSSAATCSSCSITCDASACPEGFACGVDQLCHAGAARLGAPSVPQPYAIDEMRVSDIDKDGIGDVVGVSRTAIDVRYGDALGALTEGDRALTPSQGGVPGFGDLDGDGSLDVGFGTGDGVVVYTSPFDKLSPLSQRQPIGIPGVTVEAMLTINTEYFAFIVAREGSRKLELIVSSSLARGQPIGTTFDPLRPDLPGTLCGDRLTAQGFSPNRVEGYVAQTFELASIPIIVDYVVAFTGTNAAGNTASCVTSIRINLFESDERDYVKFYDVTPNQAPGVRLVLARLDTDVNNPCPALVAPDLGNDRVATWAGAMVTPAAATAHCGIANTPTPYGFTNLVSSIPAPDAVSAGHLPLVPAATFPVFGESFDLTFGRDAIVLSDGIYAPIANSTELARLYKSTRAIRRMATGDFDGDGAVDLVATTDGEDDLDILYRRDYSFQLYRVDTASRISNLIVGDFDGDEISDVAIVEPVERYERLSIAYGAPTFVSPPIEVESFARAKFVALIGIGSTLDQINAIDDLVVLDEVDASTTALTILQGSPQRTMLSYFDPRFGENPMTGVEEGAEAQIAGVVFGRFGTGDGLGAAVIGVASQLFEGEARVDEVFAPVRVWPMVAGETGLDPVLGGHGSPVPGFAGCGIDSAPTTSVCIPQTRYTLWPLANRDVVVAVDKQQVPRAATVTIQSSFPAPAITANVPLGATVRSLRPIDVDGDGVLELLAAFGAEGDRDAGAAGLVEVCAMDGSGVATSCEDAGAAVAGATCVAAAAASFGLVVACYPTGATTASLYRVAKVDGAYTSELLAPAVGPIRALEVGDVTGDRVEDVIGLVGGFGAESMIVFPQCTTRDIACGGGR